MPFFLLHLYRMKIQYNRIGIDESRANKLYHKYTLMEQVGSGTYGCVYKAINKNNPQKQYALKHLDYMKTVSPEGFPITSFRQIILLQSLHHQNILQINQIVYLQNKSDRSKPSEIYLCLDYMQHDIFGINKCRQKFSIDEKLIRYIMKMLLQGMQYLHQQGIVHRDIKSKYILLGANILVNKKGEVKIADFGLAKYIRGIKHHTSKVVTLWYRAPQLLLGFREYQYKIDIWALGCLMAQLLLGKPIFQHSSQKDTIQAIFSLCGTPDNNYWIIDPQHYVYYKQFQPKQSKLNNLVMFLKEKCPKQFHINRFKQSSLMLNLLNKLLALNPSQRLTASQALKHPFFDGDQQFEQVKSRFNIDMECHSKLGRGRKTQKEQIVNKVQKEGFQQKRSAELIEVKKGRKKFKLG